MTKRELVVQVAERVGGTQNEVAGIVQATLDAITDFMAAGKRLEVRDFGVFEIKTRDARSGRNPRTGEEVRIGAKSVVAFKPGKALKELVRQGGIQRPDAATAADEAPASEVTYAQDPEEERQQTLF